jgi:hypothetical protein
MKKLREKQVVEKAVIIGLKTVNSLSTFICLFIYL